MRQRREPAAGAGGRTPAGVCDSRGSGRALDASRAPASGREPDARRVGRRTGSGSRLRRPARAGGDRAVEPAPAGRNLDRPVVLGFALAISVMSGLAVRAHPDPQVRPAAARGRARRRRPWRQPDARAPAVATGAGGSADGAGAGAAGERGPDDPQFPGASPRRSRFYRAPARADVQHLDSGDAWSPSRSA